MAPHLDHRWAVVAGALLSLLLAPACDDETSSVLRRGGVPEFAESDYSLIIEPGKEDVVVQAVAPLTIGGALDGQLRFASANIERAFVAFRVELQADPESAAILELHHASADVTGAGEKVFAGENCQLWLRATGDVDFDDAKTMVAQVRERLEAFDARADELWTMRDEHGAEPGRDRNTSPAGVAVEAGDVQGDPVRTGHSGHTLAVPELSAERILIGAGVLLLLLMIVSGLPAFLRKKK